MSGLVNPITDSCWWKDRQEESDPEKKQANTSLLLTFTKEIGGKIKIFTQIWKNLFVFFYVWWMLYKVVSNSILKFSPYNSIIFTFIPGLFPPADLDLNWCHSWWVIVWSLTFCIIINTLSQHPDWHWPGLGRARHYDRSQDISWELNNYFMGPSNKFTDKTTLWIGMTYQFIVFF